MPWIVIQRLPLSQIEAPTTELPRIVSPTRWKWRLYLPEHPLLAQVAELGVADRAGRVAVVHRVAADAVGVGRLDDDVAAQVGDLAAVVALAEVVELERAVEGRASSPSIARIVRSSVNVVHRVRPRRPEVASLAPDARWVAVTITRSPTRQPGTGSASVTTVLALRGGRGRA